MPRPVLLFEHPACELHDPGPDHPDALARLPALRAALAADADLAPQVVVRDAPPASEDDLRLVHTADHVERVRAGVLEATRRGAPVWLDEDTAVIELLVTAPWNLLGPEDPPDPRTVRGAGTALVAAASTWSVARGCGGAVALQAATLRAATFYERLGFRRMHAADGPLGLVPSGASGWSPEILRVAAGQPGPKEHDMPWLYLEPGRAFAAPRPMMPAVG